MDKQVISIAALVSAVVSGAFFGPPDLVTRAICVAISVALTVGAGFAIRKLESPDNPLPQALYARVASCSTLGLVIAVVLINLLGVTQTSLE